MKIYESQTLATCKGTVDRCSSGRTERIENWAYILGGEWVWLHEALGKSVKQ